MTNEELGKSANGEKDPAQSEEVTFAVWLLSNETEQSTSVRSETNPVFQQTGKRARLPDEE